MIMKRINTAPEHPKQLHGKLQHAGKRQHAKSHMACSMACPLLTPAAVATAILSNPKPHFKSISAQLRKQIQHPVLTALHAQKGQDDSPQLSALVSWQVVVGAQLISNGSKAKIKGKGK